MSKLIDALNKVKEERQRQAGPVLASFAASPALSPVSRQDRSSSGLWRVGYGLTAVLLVVAVTGSVLVNFKTMDQLENAGAMTLALSRHMDEQKQELVAIRRHWMDEESARKDQREQIIVLQQNVNSLKKNLGETKSGLAKIEDLKINNKLLLEKFVALNDKVKKISEMNVVNGK